MVAECNLNIHVCLFSAFTIRDTTNLYFDFELIINIFSGLVFSYLFLMTDAFDMKNM